MHDNTNFELPAPKRIPWNVTRTSLIQQIYFVAQYDYA